MKKLSLNNIVCIQLDELTTQVKILFRDGDKIYTTGPINITKLTLQQIQNGEHRPDN